MIIALRKMIKGTAGKVFMGIIFLAMFGGFGLSKIFLKLFKSENFEGVALVNGVDISKMNFHSMVKQEEDRILSMRQQYGKNADLYFKIMGINPDPENSALVTLIYAEIMKTFAQDMGIYISEEYVNNRLADQRFLTNELGSVIPQEFFVKGSGLDVPAALDFLKRTGQLTAIYSELEEKLTKQFAILMLQSGFFVPSFMLKQAYIEQKLAKKFSYQLFSLDTFLAKAKAEGASAEQLKAFYTESNKTGRKYWTAETRDGIVWKFSPEQFGVVISDEDIEQYYGKNKSTRFVQNPLEVKVREIVFGDAANKGLMALEEEANEVHARLLQNPSLFNELSKQYSTDKATAGKDGVFFKRGTKDKEYEKAAFKLKEDGDISEVTLVGQEYVILQRVARKDATFKTLDAVHGEIKKTLLEQKFKAEFTRQANQLVRHDDTQEAFDAFVKKHAGSKEVLVQAYNCEQSVIKQRLFVMKNDGDKAVFVHEGTGIILQLTSKTKAEPLSFEKAQTAVSGDYYENRATKNLESAIAKAKTAALDAKKIVAVDGGKMGETERADFSDNEKSEKYIKMGFPQGFNELDWVGAVLSSLNETGGIVIVLDEIEKAQEDAYQDHKNKLMKHVYERNSGLFSQAFIASLFRTATIKVNDELSRLKEQL